MARVKVYAAQYFTDSRPYFKYTTNQPIKFVVMNVFLG